MKLKRLILSLALLAPMIRASAADPQPAGQLLTLPSRSGVTQGVYVETATASPQWVVVLFGGNEGALHLNADGATTLRGNFLIRTAGYWVQRGDAAVLVDTPSDNANGVDDGFRLGKDSLTDTQTIVKALRQRFPSSKIALVGTSRGTVSVGNAIARDPGVADAFVLTSPVSNAHKCNAGLSGLDVDGTTSRVLVVSNRHDACPSALFYGAERLAERNHFDFVAVDSTQGGGDREADCGGHSPHGFLGIESEVLGDISGWLRGEPAARQ